MNRFTPNCRAASSNVKAPSTSVLMKSSAQRIERSTCVSAAKLTTMSMPSLQNARNSFVVGNVAFDELVPVGIGKIAQIIEVAGVAEFVEIDDVPVGMFAERELHEVRADEAGASRNQNTGHRRTPSRRATSRLVSRSFSAEAPASAHQPSRIS